MVVAVNWTGWRTYRRLFVMALLCFAVAATYLRHSPGLNAMLVLLLCTVVGAIYYGWRGTWIVALVYALPIVIMHLLNQASPAEWAFLLAKLVLVVLTSYLALLISGQIVLELRQRRLKTRQLQRELQRLRCILHTTEEIMRQTDATRVAVCRGRVRLYIPGCRPLPIIALTSTTTAAPISHFAIVGSAG